ncbi:hypothetical protein [Salinilacihabitans rarus]|uniref:hypothetical protein n=1 Tax=Salinilacihabitans rarus TaxID=2961596 RepID=UPI0020C8B288|nr:hypothetical protein [Salinilacihabitans rarus]
MTDPNEGAEAVTEAAAEGLDGLEDALRSIDDLVDPDEEHLGSVIDRLDRLERVAREAEELLASIDLAELPDAVDEEELVEAVETGEIPDAIAEGEADEVVRVRRLLRAINLRELLDVGNVVEISREANEFEEAVGNVRDGGDGGEDDGILGKATDAVGDDEGGMLETAVEEGEELVAEGKEAASDEFGVGSLDPAEGEEFGLDAEDTEAYQRMVQDRAVASIEEFREALLVVHGKFQKVYDFNREHLRREDASTHSRNPTAASTMPIERADMRAADRLSTVPRQVKYSTAPGFDRIYGSRFERELEKRRGDNE